MRTYVIQVATGRELKTIALIERWFEMVRQTTGTPAAVVDMPEECRTEDVAAPHRASGFPPCEPGRDAAVSALLHAKNVRLFAPRFQYRKKIKGSWELVEELLTPGYIYLRAPLRTIDELKDVLVHVPAFTKLLAQDGKIIPLHTEDELWLSRLTGEDHVGEPSIGFIEGDQVVITQGPLQGMESQIKKIDRHKRLAYLEVSLMGRTKLIKVGVEIVRKHGRDSVSF